MEYSEIQSVLTNKKTELDTSRNYVNKLRSTLESLNTSIESLKSNEEEELEKEKEKQHQKFCEDIRKPFLEKIKDLDAKKVKLRESRNSLLDKVNSETYRRKLEESGVDIDKERENCKNIEEKLNDFYGDEFSQAIKDVLVLDNNSNKSVSEVMSNVKQLEPIFKNRFNISDLVDKLLEGLEEENPDKELDKNKILLAGVGSLALIGVAIYASPIVLGLIIGNTAFCCVKSFIFSKYSSDLKYLSDSADRLEEMKKKAIDTKIKNKIDEIENKYNESMANIDNHLKKINVDMEEELKSNESNFVFNSSKIKEDYKLSINEKLSEIDRVKKELLETDNSISKLQKEVEELEKSLEDELNNLVYKFMPREVQNNILLPDNYLIDMKGQNPTFFEDKRKPTLFIYDSRENLYEFIKLFFLQTTLRVEDGLVKFQVYDCNYFGECLQQFVNSELVRIFTSKNDMDMSLSANETEIKRRVILKAQYNDIYEYNEFMRSIDCPQETYYYNLVMDFESNLLDTPSMTSLLNLGSSCGYFPYFFISNKIMSESDEKSIKLFIEKFDFIYEITETVKKLSKLKLRKMILENK